MDVPSGATRLTVAEIAEDLRVSRMTVYRLISAGEIKASRIGRSIRVNYDDYREFLRAEAHSG